MIFVEQISRVRGKIRVFKTIGIVIGIYAAAIITEVIMFWMSPDYEGGVSVLVILGILGFLTTKSQSQCLERSTQELMPKSFLATLRAS